ncbi:hypothetical protein GCM10023332_11390 [Luteimonas vadosa]|uniref:Methyltransferase FkbM domain-containing protein n=2 Tax=Luteimonas vadosa TaxID=1165507 RepID=A0ABP9DVB3_9GAMM
MYFDGTFTVNVDKGRSFQMVQHNRYGIETELFWKGLAEGWETESISIWMELCKEAHVILDIGAAEGLYALVSKCLRPASRVLAFEPFALPSAELRGNISLNGYDIEVHEVALSDFSGEASFYATLESSNEGSLIPSPCNPGSRVAQRVRVATLADIIEREGLERVDLIKVDVEGAEPEVLGGMGPYLERFRPSIIVEILNDDVGRRVQERVEGLDYLYFDVNDDLRKGPKGIRRVPEIRKSVCLNYLLIQRPVASSLGIA